MDRVVQPLEGPGVSSRPVEIVERKGIGHPDTVCDALAEELSVALCRFYVERFGTVLHHNVDKVLLRGGRSAPRLGGGAVLEPIEIYLGGRATTAVRGAGVPLEALANEAVQGWIAAHLRALDAARHVRVHCLVRPGSQDLVELFGRGGRRGVPLANDTSCGVGYAPLSMLERVVLDVERCLNDPQTKARHPALGEDVKVMGIRHGTHVRLTVAVAMIDRHLGDRNAYREAVEQARALAREAARTVAPDAVDVEVNTADDLASGSLYLTVTGTSAEAGDDGQAGRGNRGNGLIAPYRPTTMESLAGKNPVTHVGKLYNVAARRIAERLVEQIEEVEEAGCALVSRIGHPIGQPQIADVRLRVADPRRVPALRPRVDAIVDAELEAMQALWRAVIERAVQLY